MMIQETKGRFGFHLIGGEGGEDELRPPHVNIQFYVKSSKPFGWTRSVRWRWHTQADAFWIS